jgi:hypothetical protein
MLRTEETFNLEGYSGATRTLNTFQVAPDYIPPVVTEPVVTEVQVVEAAPIDTTSPVIEAAVEKPVTTAEPVIVSTNPVEAAAPVVQSQPTSAPVMYMSTGGIAASRPISDINGINYTGTQAEAPATAKPEEKKQNTWIIAGVLLVVIAAVVYLKNK